VERSAQGCFAGETRIKKIRNLTRKDAMVATRSFYLVTGSLCAFWCLFNSAPVVSGTSETAVLNRVYFSRGIALSGGEYNEKRNSAVYGHDYIYPSPQELDYYAQKGFAVVRLPYRWERLQRVLFGSLDVAELVRISRVVSAAADRHMQVILSPHNFGRRLHEGKQTLIGTDGVTVEAFADFSNKVARAFAGNDAIYGLSLMNEPHDSQNLWKQTAQAALDGIRRADRNRLVLVPGDEWSGAWSWKQFNDDFLLNDPANRIVYEAHQFFDIDHSGAYKTSYTLNGATPDRGVEWVRPFAEWLKQHGQKGIITEFGVPNNDPRWLELTHRLLLYLAQEKIPWTYWAGGPWWGDYPLSAEPRNGIDAPIMTVLTKDYTAMR
jgi:endoglucanase